MASRKWTFGKSNPSQEREEELEELFVFGYECKLFRDDERAMHIDRGKHLIPWMGDEKVLIDRYDGRGHLFNLKPYDANYIPQSAFELSDEEKRIEALCDEERYLEIHTDLSEKALYEEEELKRLNEELMTGDNTYIAVGFNYDQQYYDPSEPTAEQAAANNLEDQEEEEYEPCPELQVPPGMIVPQTVKLNLIIEKTAGFIAEHGPQMEIIIKTKQQDNPQFSFLNFDDPVYAYYKHVVKMVKSGRYKPHVSETKKSDDSTKDHHDYLHPSLVKQTEVNLAPENFLSSVQSKVPSGQIANTPYAKLVSRLAQHTGRNSPDPSSLNQSSSAKPKAETISKAASCPTLDQTAVNPGASSLPQSSLGTSYAYGPSLPPGLPPVPGLEPVVLPPPATHHHATHLPTTTAASTHGHQPPPPGTAPLNVHSRSVAAEPSTSHSEITAAHQPHTTTALNKPKRIIQPPADVQPIIDKMALYVAKNGIEFEIVVRSKKDKRFEFIHDWHPHYAYYEDRKSHYLKKLAEDRMMVEQDKAEAAKQDQSNKAVIFTIKTKDTEQPSLSRNSSRALLYESSDEEEGEKSQEEYPISSEPPRDMMPHAQSMPVLSSAPTVAAPQPPVQEMPLQLMQPLHAMPEHERKLLEEKLREKLRDRLADRLAVAAREKLAQTSKEKQIQAERKRKAAMFISMLKGSQGSSEATSEETKTSSSPVPTVSPLSSTSETGAVVIDYGHRHGGQSADAGSKSPLSLASSTSNHTPQLVDSRSQSPIAFTTELESTEKNVMSEATEQIGSGLEPICLDASDRAALGKSESISRAADSDLASSKQSSMSPRGTSRSPRLSSRSTRSRTPKISSPRQKSRSPSKSKSLRQRSGSPRHRSRSPKHSSSKSRHRSRSPRRRSRSPRKKSRSPKRRHRSKTPPSAYARIRRVTSPDRKRRKSRSKSPKSKSHSKSSKSRRKRSRSRSRSKRHRSRSPKDKSKKKSKKRKSRSRSPSKSKSSRASSPSHAKKMDPVIEEKSEGEISETEKEDEQKPEIESTEIIPQVSDVEPSTEGQEELKNGTEESAVSAEPAASDPPKPVNQDLLSKVRAMLQATRDDALGTDAS